MKKLILSLLIMCGVSAVGIAEPLEKLSLSPEELRCKLMVGEIKDLQNKDLRGLFFSNLDLTGVDFSGSDLTGADFNGSHTILVEVKFDHTNLTDSNFEGSQLKDVSFVNANLEKTKFNDATLVLVMFKGNSLVMRKTDFTKAKLEKCWFENINGNPCFANALIQDCVFIDVVLHGASLRDAILLGTDTNTSGFHGGRIESVDLTGVSFINVLFVNTRLQTEYRGDDNPETVIACGMSYMAMSAAGIALVTAFPIFGFGLVFTGPLVHLGGIFKDNQDRDDRKWWAKFACKGLDAIKTMTKTHFYDVRGVNGDRKKEFEKKGATFHTKWERQTKPFLKEALFGIKRK